MSKVTGGPPRGSLWVILAQGQRARVRVGLVGQLGSDIQSGQGAKEQMLSQDRVRRVRAEQSG